MRVFILRGFARGGCMLKYGIVRFCYKKCYTAGFNQCKLHWLNISTFRLFGRF